MQLGKLKDEVFQIMEYVRCDVCGSTEYRYFMRRVDRYSGEVFQYVKCKICELIYLNPRPCREEIIKYYPNDYEAFDIENLNNPSIRNNNILQLKYVEKYVTNRGKLLDIGCGMGGFLSIANERGWFVKGIEPNPVASEIARIYLKIDVLNGNLQEISLPKDYFDVITFWDVLEHLYNPKETLKICYNLLKDGGFLIFSIPNINSFDRFFFGNKWIGWDAPRHFNLFSERHVSKILEETGFDLMDRNCISGGKGSFYLSMMSVLEESQTKRFKKISKMIDFLLFPYRKFSYLLKMGPIINYVAKKNNSIKF